MAESEDVNTHVISTTFQIRGLKDDDDVKRVLQRLYDSFAAQGMGQATIEMTEDYQQLVVKHQPDRTPDKAVIAEALQGAGGFELLD